jgi:hypothetical protein
MSVFGDTFVSGSRFLFWAISPFLLVGGWCFFGLAWWPIGDNGPPARFVNAGLGLFCWLLILFLYHPERFWLAGRIITGTVFLVYLAYLISEWVWDAQDLGIGKPRSSATPLNATLGFLIIGLPCLWWTLFGRFSLRRQHQGPGP